MTPRIIYLSPADNAPTGGIKVIYRHAEALAGMGVDAYVLHPFDTGFRCDWFPHQARMLNTLTLDPARDFVIIPELWAAEFGPQCIAQGVRFGLFVQNGYFTHPLLPSHTPSGLQAIYAAAELILSISDDTSRMVAISYPGVNPDKLLKVQYSVSARFAMAECAKAPVVSFMPRKMADHAMRVVYALGRHLPRGWRIQAIDGVGEAGCAMMLAESSIFMAFSSFEGLPLPPLEAAIAGNLVIGYTGQGAKEYWHKPNFQEIHQGDIAGFIEAVAAAAQAFEAGKITPALLAPGAQTLAASFTEQAEKTSLHRLAQRFYIKQAA